MTGTTPETSIPDPTYDPGSGTYVVDWDPKTGEDLGILVVMGVAAVADLDHTELQPLNQVVDPDALNKLFAPRKDGVQRVGGRVSFTLSGYHVTVYSEGRIVIDPIDEGERTPVDVD